LKIQCNVEGPGRKAKRISIKIIERVNCKALLLKDVTGFILDCYSILFWFKKYCRHRYLSMLWRFKRYRHWNQEL